MSLLTHSQVSAALQMLLMKEPLFPHFPLHNISPTLVILVFQTPFSATLSICVFDHQPTTLVSDIFDVPLWP